VEADASLAASDVPDARRLTTWRRRLEGRRPVQELTVPVPGAARPYLIAAPADPDAVLDQTDLAPDAHMPYWATPWASGLFLAEVVLARREALRGRRVLELGCGLGTTAAAAAEAQAGAGGLVCADVFAETLAYCRYNALRNAGRAPQTLLADWRTAPGREALAAAGPFDLVLAADVLYEPEDVPHLLGLAPRLVAAGGELWLAEPGRATSGRFVGEATGRGWGRGVLEAERDWPAGAGHALVKAHVFGGIG
jgi:predicted nicotinamide N-methyase